MSRDPYPYVCWQCGKPRSYGSASRCRSCYLENAAFKREGPFEREVMTALLHGELIGELHQTPEGWTLTGLMRDGTPISIESTVDGGSEHG